LDDWRVIVTYTINGKEYTEFDINRRCAELLAWESEPNVKSVELGGEGHNCFWVEHVGFSAFLVQAYCNNITDAWPIIEKCWDELNDIWLEKDGKTYISLWKYLVQKHNCTKLVAACICFIEINEGGAE
jgi:hypothetical protein